MKSKIAITSALGVLVIVLLFLNLRAILRPAKYQEVYEQRVEMNENRLTAISVLQELFHERYHYYASDIDTLINFYETGEMISVNTNERPPQDSLTDEKFMEKFMNMTMKQREECGYVVFDTVRTTVKARMESELAEKNAKKDPGHLITMDEFYNIPFNNQKYKIIVPNDSVVSKFMIVVPKEQLLNDFSASLPQSAFSKILYGGMDKVYDKKEAKNNLKDLREIKNFAGVKLGDTTNFTLDIVTYE